MRFLLCFMYLGREPRLAHVSVGRTTNPATHCLLLFLLEVGLKKQQQTSAKLLNSLRWYFLHIGLMDRTCNLKIHLNLDIIHKNTVFRLSTGHICPIHRNYSLKYSSIDLRTPSSPWQIPIKSNGFRPFVVGSRKTTFAT